MADTSYTTERLKCIFQPGRREFENRAKFLSKLFGTFSEQIVSIWASHSRCRYEDIGRPTLRTDSNQRGYTLDFTLRERTTGKFYVCEMKCEIQYQNFRYFILDDTSQLDHHKKPAFRAFLDTAHPRHQHSVFVGKKLIKTSGAILIWGAATQRGRKKVMEDKGFFDVLTVESICSDLRNWESGRYLELVAEKRSWANRLFDGIV